MNDFIELMNALGVNVHIKDNKLYFLTKDSKEVYDVVYAMRNSLDVHSEKYIKIDKFNDLYALDLIVSFNRYDMFSIEFPRVNVDNFVTYIKIIEKNDWYLIKYENRYGKAITIKKHDDRNNIKSTIILHNQGIWVTESNEEYNYYLDKDSNDQAISHIKKIIESSKYFSLALDYYSKIDPEFMDIYNSFMADCTYLGR